MRRVGAPLYNNHLLLHTHGDKDAAFTQLLLPEERSYEVDRDVSSPAASTSGGDAHGSPVLGPSHPSSADSSPSGRRQVEVLLNFTLQVCAHMCARACVRSRVWMCVHACV